MKIHHRHQTTWITTHSWHMTRACIPSWYDITHLVNPIVLSPSNCNPMRVTCFVRRQRSPWPCWTFRDQLHIRFWIAVTLFAAFQTCRTWVRNETVTVSKQNRILTHNNKVNANKKCLTWMNFSPRTTNYTNANTQVFVCFYDRWCFRRGRRSAEMFSGWVWHKIGNK